MHSRWNFIVPNCLDVSFCSAFAVLLSAQRHLYWQPVLSARHTALRHLPNQQHIFLPALSDRLEIYSPGGMYRGKPIQECGLDEIDSVRRNPVIADLFHRMKFMEHRGSGIKKILDETAKLPGYTEELKPTFHSTHSSFFVTLKNMNYSSPSLEVASRRFWMKLQNCPDIQRN